MSAALPKFEFEGFRPYSTANIVRSASMSRDRATYLSDLSQGPSLLSEIDDNTAAAILRFLDSFLDTEDQVRPASANIGSEHVATIALCTEVSSEVLGKERWW
jgi:hypothetical protein